MLSSVSKSIHFFLRGCAFCYARSGIKSLRCMVSTFIYTFVQNKCALGYEFCRLISPHVIKTVNEMDVYDLIRKVKMDHVLSLLLKISVHLNTRRKTPLHFVYYFCVVC